MSGLKGFFPLISLNKNTLSISSPGMIITKKISSTEIIFVLLRSMIKQERINPKRVEPLFPKNNLFWKFLIKKNNKLVIRTMNIMLF